MARQRQVVISIRIITSKITFPIFGQSQYFIFSNIFKTILLWTLYNYHTFNFRPLPMFSSFYSMEEGERSKKQMSCILYLFDNCVTLMGDLLLNWLNDEIQLSKRITNFQEDFQNGYLFGELLAKYSQQLNFHEFVDKDDKASRVKNYSLLLETFSALRVTFDSNVAMKIINKQLGVSKKLLYELKTQLQKTNANAFSKTNRMNKTLEPLKKLHISKQKFDNVNKEHFVKQLNQMHPAQKQIIQDKLLRKFGDFHNSTLMKAAHEEEKQRQAKLLLRKKFNEQQRDNLQKSEEFRRQWQAQHLDKWAVNMTIRQTQVAKDEQFRSKLNFEKNQYKTMTQVSALKSLENDIAQFERRNIKKREDDSDQDVSPDVTKQLKALKQSGKVLQRTDPHQMVRNEPREERRIPAAEAEKRRHQREKRRRKMIVQQQKRYQMIQITRRERIIISTIEQTSRQEKEIQYEIWRAWENKSIITENKELQTERIKEKVEVRDINSKFKKDELLKVKRQEHRQEVNNALYATKLLERNNQVKNRKGTYNLCQDMVMELLNITEDMYVRCQEKNQAEIHEKQLEEALIKFVEGTKTSEQEASLRLKHYINGTHQWGFPINRPEEQVPTDPKEDNALPNEPVNNYYLGNILRTIFEKLYASSNQFQQNEPSAEKILISMVGLDYARKHFLAENVKVKHQFNVIYVDQLIEEKLKDCISLQQKNVEISKQTQELADCCFSGKSVPDSIVIQLVKDKVEKNPHSILVDYPNTYEQAIALCKAIGNVQPHDMLATNKLTKKIKEYERLVKGTSSRLVERRIRQCGIDFVWWIDVTAQNSLDRMLGRRWIGETQVHISDNIEPEDIREGEKSAALVLNNHFKASNKNKIKEWFELFGTKVGDLENAALAKCWEQIDGNGDKQQLELSIQAKVEEILALKQKQKQWLDTLSKQNKEKQEKQEQINKTREQIKAKCVKTNPEAIKEQLDAALNKVSLNQQFVEQITDLWNRIESATISSLNKAFTSLGEQQTNQRQYIAHIKRHFISLLTREDHKFHLIKDFQNNYNEFISDNEDMLTYDYTKEQLHQRVEDLENDLLEVVQEKKQDAVTERNGIMNSGWLEAQLEIINEALYVLVQSELSKFAMSQKLITDFYGKKFMANTKSFEPLAPELNLETINTLEIYKDGIASRLDKMIAEAIRLMNREEDVSDDKNKKGGKGAPKKDDKKAGKKGKDEVEQNKEPTTEEIELKKAINTEKAILRQRLNKIKTLGLNKLKNTFESAQKLYTQLEDLQVYTEKVEKKAIFGLAKIFRKSIQNEQRIESEVQIKHVEVTQTEKIRNFEKIKPVVQPARETPTDNHFSLSNLNEVIKLLKEEAQGHKISTKKLIVLLKKLVSNLELRKLLPQSWKSVSNEQIEAFVKLLDHQNKSYVELVKVFIFMVMSGYRMPTNDEVEQYNLELTNYSSIKEATQIQFTSAKAWFDEPLDQQQNIRPFKRNQFIKDLLFSIFKGSNDTVNIAPFIEVLTLSEYYEQKQPQENWSYFEMAFG